MNEIYDFYDYGLLKYQGHKVLIIKMTEFPVDELLRFE
jgi:hypothetical protein